MSAKSRAPATAGREPSQTAHPPKLQGLVGYVIRRAQMAVFRDFLSATKDVGITPAQFSLLTIVAERPGLKQTTLSAALEVKRANLATMLDVMESRGLIARQAVSNDARANSVTITAAGRKTLDRLDVLVTTHDAKITGGLNELERAQLIRLLASVIRNCGSVPAGL